MKDRMTESAQANTCHPHHFTWTWPIEGGQGSVGVCDLCGAVTTGERDTIKKAEALREAADDWHDIEQAIEARREMVADEEFGDRPFTFTEAEHYRIAVCEVLIERADKLTRPEGGAQ